MVDKPVRVAIYARVSTQEQAVEGTSLDYQADQLSAYCQAQGWTITGKYVDPGYSGKDDERPALKQILTDAKSRLFDKIVIYKLDRLARKLRLLLDIEEKLKEHGVSLHSVRETLDTSTAIGRTVFQMLGLVSEWERETIIERTKAGRLQRYKEGCWGPGSPPFGYDYDRDKTKKLIINEDEARVIRRIYDEYSKGKSMTQVANMLNEEKIPPRNPKKGKGWRNTSIRDVLFNPVYKGTQIVNIYQKHSRLPEEIPESAIKIEVPPIVDKALWNIAQERRKNNKHLQPPRSEHWLLQGLITCGLCGYTFSTGFTHNRREYGCRGRLKYTHIDGSPRCTSPRLDAEWLEQEIWQRIEGIINDPNKLDKLLKETVDSLKNREADLNARIKPIDDRLAEIASQKTRLAEEWVQSSISSTRLQEIKRDLDQEEARLRSIRTEIDPAQLEELEQIRGLLRFWNGQLGALSWNTETEDGRMVRTIDKPHKIASTIIGFEDKELTSILSFPATKREVLDLLQVRVIAFIDRVEVKAIFPIKPIDCQLLRSDCRSGRCPPSR
ncbi:MAG: recombinase family protein [Deltaproteobacteria bacterium]|nr:recombinase family protein [Deltaproteobacteria bacterium]